MADTQDDSDKGSRVARTVMPCLHVVLEGDRPMAGSARYALEGIDQVTIGRGDSREATRRQGPVPTIDLKLPGPSLSTSHARLVRVGYSWAVEDLGSKNGTFVDGERVTRAVLTEENLLETGHTFFCVRNVALPSNAAGDLDISRPTEGHATLDGMFERELDQLACLFKARLPALLVGESGTGKEVLARWLHVTARRPGEFIAVNCGALPAQLMESQLFGHVKGAFSGAVRDEPGLVRSAHGGTLFLDEIGDLPRGSQAALLRVLQEREVVPVGATRPIRVDVDVIAASQEPLESHVDRGEFRQDLFARVAGCVLHIPPLRERRSDMGLIMASLFRKLAPGRVENLRISAEAARALLTHAWPMNVRELETCLATCVALANDGEVTIAHLPSSILKAIDAVAAHPRPPSVAMLSEREERLRLELLGHISQHQGNLAEVARAMGKARMQIHRWCKRFNVDPNVFRH